MNIKNLNITFIGAGHMATAMIDGLLKHNFPAQHITATNKTLEKLTSLPSSIHKITDNNAAIEQADVIVLAVKPQSMKACITALKIKNNPLIISIAAGISMASLENWLGANQAIVRAMPNMPATINAGATGLFANKRVNSTQKLITETLFQSIGVSAWLAQESLIDVVIAIAGSAPAYYFYLMDILQQFAIEQGMDAETANLFIRQTCAGSGLLALQHDSSNQDLMRTIMSPGGTTEVAVQALSDAQYPQIMHQALMALLQRSQELASKNT